MLSSFVERGLLVKHALHGPHHGLEAVHAEGEGLVGLAVPVTLLPREGTRLLIQLMGFSPEPPDSKGLIWKVLCFGFFVVFFFCFFRAMDMAYGSSQARGRVRAKAAGLHHSHSVPGSEPCLQPSPWLTAMPDPQFTDRGQGLNPPPLRY